MRSERGEPATFTQSARRAQMVACAIEVIAEVGWAQTSIRKIAERVGVAMSAVLYHFGSKDNLVDAVLEEMYRTALAVVVPAVEAQSTAADQLAAYIRANIAYFDGHRSHIGALAQLATGYQPRDGRRFDELGLSPELREELAALDPAVILAAGQRDREFADFPVGSMALALRGAVNAVVEKLLRDPDFDPHTYGEDLVALFGRAVGVSR
ncbi:TetR/AcrR family transcriptional regulator [Mycobacterium talmoniae]|uniref:TetR family transcriptional regulator n=1 Tax=Mycobacterium talmoniae TaxID=1858794 RepID=A0A1S1NFY2_9MYCO|nr:MULTISPECIES: TetR/AcrR family transcriptional regulator [Mycobacterium]OHU99780.1 TetR family transcriptional regulator [Mycobacterium talmoniae]PQM49608.1 Tetracycline repressor protein class G [Mycobacterium talmoniae]TDH48671.1 TetR/AcrR family transcriptional regulator [Mycobacterium eburneum]